MSRDLWRGTIVGYAQDHGVPKIGSMAAFWDWDDMPGVEAYNDTHKEWRKTVRAWMDAEIIPFVEE